MEKKVIHITTREVMSFEKFKYIIENILKIQERREKIADFFEAELCTGSWAMFDFAENIDDMLIHLLADEFNCWYATWSRNKGEEETQTTEWWNDKNKYNLQENDIEYWLYGSLNEEKKIITVDGKDIDITSIEDFYNYLINYCLDRNKK